jgi:hypothetical protein
MTPAGSNIKISSGGASHSRRRAGHPAAERRANVFWKKRADAAAAAAHARTATNARDPRMAKRGAVAAIAASNPAAQTMLALRASIDSCSEQTKKSKRPAGFNMDAKYSYFLCRCQSMQLELSGEVLPF